MQRGVINWVFILLAGVTIHGGPSSQRGTRKHLWELYHPEGSVVTGVTGWDPRSGRQPGVEKRQCWQRRARLAAAAGLRLQLCTLTQDGQTPAEVRNRFHREQLYSKVMCHTCPPDTFKFIWTEKSLNTPPGLYPTTVLLLARHYCNTGSSKPIRRRSWAQAPPPRQRGPIRCLCWSGQPIGKGQTWRCTCTALMAS